MIYFLILMLTSFISIPENLEMQDIKIHVKIIGISNLKGEIRIAIYSESNDFPSKTDILDFKVIPIDSTSVSCTFIVQKAGRYAMALIQDLNKNAELDFNFIGYPKEPYGFSNNPGVWYRAPTFNECAIEVDENKTIEIKM